MRVRIGNPYNEAHGHPMRVLEWIAPATTDPSDLPDLLAKALPGVRLIASPDGGEVHGSINTARTADGSLYVAVLLYDHGCDDRQCEHHLPGSTAILALAPELKESHHAAMKKHVGEHSRHKLGRDEKADQATLATLGFGHHEHMIVHRRLGTLPNKSLVEFVDQKPCPGCREHTDPPMRSE